MAVQEGFRLVESSLFDRMRQHCLNCEGFNLPFEDLPDGRVATAMSEQRQNTSQTSKKSQAFDRFMKNAPIGHKWRERQCELGLITTADYKRVLRSLSCRSDITFEAANREQDKGAEIPIVALGKRLAKLTKASLDNLQLQRSFAYFQVLLFLSYCDFLLKREISEEVVDQLVQSITKARERDRKGLLRSIRWIHKLLKALVRRGWTVFRATELFFLNPLSTSDLMRIKDDANFDAILKQLSAGTFVEWNFDDCLTPQYTIPGLIVALLDSDQYGLDTVYTTLGYNVPDCHKTIQDVYVIHPVRNSPGSRHALELIFSTEGLPDIQGNSFFGVCMEHQDVIANLAQPLLSLIDAVRALPRIMIDRAGLFQTRWNEDGSQYQIDLQKVPLDDRLKNLFSDSTQLRLVLDHLISKAAIGVRRPDDVEVIYTASSDSSMYWTEQVLRLFCHVFPREPMDLPISVRKHILAVLDDVLERFTMDGNEVPCDDEFIETLLAVSKCGPLSKQHRMLSLIDLLLKRTRSAPYLQAKAVYQRSVLLRLQGDIIASNQLLKEFFDHTDISGHLKAHHIIGQLHLSRATNHAYKFDFSLADVEAKLWKPLNSDNITDKNLDVMWHQIYSAGKILRGQGKFDLACTFYHKCLETPGLRKSKRHLVLSHLVDTYVEINHLRRGSLPPGTDDLLNRGSRMIETEIERLRLHGPRSKGYRRLLLSLSEIKIRQNQFVAAERLLREVFSIYETLDEPDIVDRLGHIRASIALARISPLEDAESYWLSALTLGRRYYPLEEDVFTVAIIHLFLCVAQLQSNDFQGGRAAFDYAANICLRRRPQYLMPGVGTYLFEEAQDRIKSLAGWSLPMHTTSLVL